VQRIHTRELHGTSADAPEAYLCGDESATREDPPMLKIPRLYLKLYLYMDIQISRLRQKLEKNPDDPSLIKTIWGVGYILTGDTG
jgi:hypothetical protein